MNSTVLSIFAHAGHPGPETHATLTHLLVGIGLALPLMIGVTLWAKRRKQASARVNKPGQ